MMEANVIINILTWVSILLSIVSATLAIVALVFSWITYRNSSDMQKAAQAILTKISEKVEIVVEHTTHQIDKAWDYFTSGQIEKEDIVSEKIKEKEATLKEEIKADARRETIEAMKEAGLEKGKIELLVSRMETLINKSSDRTKDFVLKSFFLESFGELEAELRRYGGTITNEVFPKGATLVKIAELFRDVLDKAAFHDIEKVQDVRNRIAHNHTVNDDEVHMANSLVMKLLAYLRITQRR